MFVDFSKIRIFVRPGTTDFRKQINGLSIMVQDDMELDSLSNNLFLFCNKKRNRLKVLYWDKNGFCLWLKRLEKDRFPWPKNKEAAIEIETDKFRMLLSGIDFWNAHQELKLKEIN
jgi:transposase